MTIEQKVHYDPLPRASTSTDIFIQVLEETNIMVTLSGQRIQSQTLFSCVERVRHPVLFEPISALSRLNYTTNVTNTSYSLQQHPGKHQNFSNGILRKTRHFDSPLSKLRTGEQGPWRAFDTRSLDKSAHLKLLSRTSTPIMGRRNHQWQPVPKSSFASGINGDIPFFRRDPITVTEFQNLHAFD